MNNQLEIKDLKNRRFKNIEELKKLGLYIIEEDEIVVENNIERMCKEKGMSISDLAKLTGLSRQNINAVTKNKMKPGIDFSLKCSYVLGVPVEDIFTLTENAWIRPVKMERDNTLYIDVVNLIIIDNSEKRKQLKATGFEFYDTKEHRYLSKAEREALMKSYVEENIDERMEEVKNRYKNKKISLNKVNSISIEELKREFNERYTKIYKKLGMKIIPHIIK